MPGIDGVFDIPFPLNNRMFPQNKVRRTLSVAHIYIKEKEKAALIAYKRANH